MPGQTNLEKLLLSMSPELSAGEYVFCSIDSARYGDLPDLSPVAACVEKEGLTLVVPRNLADESDLAYESIFKRITLTVHSSLDAVGLTAAVSTKLAEHDISANIVAGYYHDHIFVQTQRATHAMAALRELSE